MGERIACSAYIPTGPERGCRNGFHDTAACWGGCAPALPMCMQEERCGRAYNASGGVPRVIADALGAAAQEGQR